MTARLVDSLPASVELAAGSGKTWTLSDTVRTIAAEGGRALVLTHTIAGVHALSAKLHEFEIDPAAYHVATITSFAIEVVCAYSELADFDVPAEVDLSRSSDYFHGAAAALGRKHIRDVYAISFSHLLVDEYQDCTQTQHQLILAIKAAIPKTVVFGTVSRESSALPAESSTGKRTYFQNSPTSRCRSCRGAGMATT